VDVQPEPGPTPGREPLRDRWRDCRGDGRHPRQWLLRNEIRARPRVDHDRRSQIGSALAAEIAAVIDLGPELLGCVSSAARPADCNRMVRTQREEQRSESQEHQHDARIVVPKHEPVKPGSEIVRWKVWILVDNSGPPSTLLQFLRWIALSPFVGTFPHALTRERIVTIQSRRTESARIIRPSSWNPCHRARFPMPSCSSSYAETTQCFTNT
jgi:hypothetical protein